MCDEDLADAATSATECTAAGADCIWDSTDAECGQVQQCPTELAAYMAEATADPALNALATTPDDPATTEINEQQVALYQIPVFVTYMQCLGTCKGTEDGASCGPQAAAVYGDGSASALLSSTTAGNTFERLAPGATGPALKLRAWLRCTDLADDDACSTNAGSTLAGFENVYTWQCYDSAPCYAIYGNLIAGGRPDQAAIESSGCLTNWECCNIMKCKGNDASTCTATAPAPAPAPSTSGTGTAAAAPAAMFVATLASLLY